MNFNIVFLAFIVVSAMFMVLQRLEINELKSKPTPKIVYTGDRLCPKDKLSSNQYIVTVFKRKVR